MLPRTPCDIQETPTHYIVMFDLAHIAREKIEVQVSGHTLMVTGAAPWLLPERLDTSRIEGSYQDGILSVHIARGNTTTTGADVAGEPTETGPAAGSRLQGARKAKGGGQVA